MSLPDVQKSTDGFKKIPIKKVGMRNIELPLKIYHTFLRRPVEVKGTFSSYCNLVEDVKGINMSRISRTLIDVLESYECRADDDLFLVMETFSDQLQKAHSTDNIYTKVQFDYPIYSKSPCTDLSSPEYISVMLETSLQGTKLKKYLHLSRTGMSLCPCSKEMSLLKNNLSPEEVNELYYLPVSLIQKIEKAGFGAHNQRSHIDVCLEVIDSHKLSIEDILAKLDQCFSCSTKTVLKRPDEKYETEVSYLGGFFNEDYKFIDVPNAGPKFVEDIARDVSFYLNTLLDDSINDYTITVNNDESIHSGNILATAVLTAGRELQ